VKKKKLFFIFLLILVVIFFLNISKIEKILPNSIKKLIPWSFVEYYYEFKNASNALNNYNYLYNVLFLPETHFVNLNLNKKKLHFKNKELKNKKIFLSQHYDTVFFTSDDGEIYFADVKNLDNIKNIILETKDNNLKKILTASFQVLDIFSDNKYFYISIRYSETLNAGQQNCNKFSILQSGIDSKEKSFQFKKIFTNHNCAKHEIVGGRMQKLNEDYLIFSLSDEGNDVISDDAQTLNNFYGKINYIELKNFNSGIYSIGHRNPQGLHVHNNKILSTEHGPVGGDEINLIEKDKNYGWPISSYGKSYFTKNLNYKKNHEKYGFQEPLFSFVKAIGISELIKIPNNFLRIDDFENLYLISSLFGRSLFLVNFDKDLKKIIFIEKIYIGERIRDLMYLKNQNAVLLSLENPTQIAILKYKNDK